MAPPAATSPRAATTGDARSLVLAFRVAVLRVASPGNGTRPSALAPGTAPTHDDSWRCSNMATKTTSVPFFLVRRVFILFYCYNFISFLADLKAIKGSRKCVGTDFPERTKNNFNCKQHSLYKNVRLIVFYNINLHLTLCFHKNNCQNIILQNLKSITYNSLETTVLWKVKNKYFSFKSIFHIRKKTLV